MPASNLDGQRRHPLIIQQQGGIDLVGVHFKAGGLAAFVPMSAHELCDQMIDLKAAFGVAGTELEGRLYEAAQTAQQVALLDEFFLRHLALHPMYRLVDHLVRRIDTTHGGVRLRDLSKEAGYSIRTVDRLFRQFFGLSPKFYSRIARFQHTLALLVANPQADLADISYASGYYDQPHFAKAFIDFTGYTPRQYAAHLTARSDRPAPNLVQFLQDR